MAGTVQGDISWTGTRHSRLTPGARELLSGAGSWDLGVGPRAADADRWGVAAALSVQVGVFLWTAAAMQVPLGVAGIPAFLAAGALAAEVIYILRHEERRNRLLSAAILLALLIDAVYIAILSLIVFLILAQGAMAGRGMLPLLGTPLLLVFAVVLDVGLVLFMVLALSLIMAVGVLMEEGPVAQLAVPLVLSMGVSVILFQGLSPGRGPRISHLRGLRQDRSVRL